MPPIETRTIVGGMSHTVKSGETLWSISKMYGVDLNALVRANSLQDSSVVNRGQVLLIPGSARQVAAPRYSASYTAGNDSFVWPVNGYVLAPFGSKIDRIRNKGVDIRASEGANVKASRSGRVVYCDSRLKGFGKTVILDHSDNYQTVYSYNSDILVRVGDIVQQNETIARVGRTGRAKEPSLHFEIRKDGEPQNPAYYLSH
jgi:lipoprotein NlpD